ncbi:MAG: hypothetical protein J5537_07070 [Lachnospiraceae bacterium]|nr:hypothetical protein [Lachnospiraceae bacterium]
MHIAVCDDNVADRKQMERLLTREGDKRRGLVSGLYVDSYGSSASLLYTPMDYDVYFLDFNSENTTGIDIAKTLIENGKRSIFVLCCGKINYREMDCPEGVKFLDKPIDAIKLSEMIDTVEECLASKEPTIEVREDNGRSFRIHESEFIYATSKGRFMDLTMTGNRSAHVLCSVDNFQSQLQNYPNLLPVNRKTFINAAHIVKLSALSVTMPGNVSFALTPLYSKYCKYIYNELNKQES